MRDSLVNRLISYRAQVLQGFRHISRKDEADLIQEVINLLSREDCVVELAVRRVCERGTSGCNVRHRLTASENQT